MRTINQRPAERLTDLRCCAVPGPSHLNLSRTVNLHSHARSRFSAPLLDVSHDSKPELSQSQPENHHPGSKPLAELSKFHLHESSTLRMDGTTTRINGSAAASAPAGGQATKPAGPLPNRVGSLPPPRLTTRTADAPRTPDSSNQSRSQAMRILSFSNNSTAFSRRPKRRRSGHEDHLVLVASRPVQSPYRHRRITLSPPLRRDGLDVSGKPSPSSR